MQEPVHNLAASFALVLGALLLLAAGVLGVRAKGRATGFGWAVVAGLAGAILAMAAALRMDTSGGLRAALAQLAVVALAALLGGLTAPVAAADTTAPTGRGLATVGRGVAWLALLGLPPTAGFHAKVMLCHSLLAAHMGGGVVLALLAGLVLLRPALGEAHTAQAPLLSPTRALCVVLLIILLVLLGAYPHLALGAGAMPEPL